MSVVARFWAKVDSSRGPDACWPWTGQRDDKGYGRLKIRARKPQPLIASRVAWELTHGRPAGTAYVLHSCDNPPCCNPAHLRLGTQTDNMTDARARGRLNPGRGERHGRAKLTSADVAFIRATSIPAKELAEYLGVHQTHVYRVRNCVQRKAG